jgi:flagellar basal-body rod protein FlgF/flagellar basal-body rod protein FlgG
VNSGFYAATTGLIAKMQALDVAANNLANVGTTGFKAQREFYRTLQTQLAQPGPTGQINQAINNFGVLGGAKTDMSAGSLDHTGNDLDAALAGPGFFTVKGPAGTAYTRNGAFLLGPHGELLTGAGDAVIGKDGPIKLPPGQVSIDTTGSISVNGTVVDQLHIAEFKDAPNLLGATMFQAPASGEQPPTQSTVRQGFLEASNINSIAGGTGLVMLQRSAEMMQKALSIFNTDFNKTATDEIAKVG